MTSKGTSWSNKVPAISSVVYERRTTALPCLRARSVSCKPKYAGNSVAFSSTPRDRHLEVRPISRLHTQPMISPVNASRLPSRVAAHHSGWRLLAKHYCIENFHLLSFASLSWRTVFRGALGKKRLGGPTVRSQRAAVIALAATRATAICRFVPKAAVRNSIKRKKRTFRYSTASTPLPQAGKSAAC
jgi:hypothetical protein